MIVQSRELMWRFTPNYFAHLSRC